MIYKTANSKQEDFNAWQNDIIFCKYCLVILYNRRRDWDDFNWKN